MQGLRIGAKLRGSLPAGFALAPLLLLASCDDHPRPDDPRLRARVVRSALVASEAPRSGALTGTVHARFESDVGFRVGGKVAARLVDAGAAVRAGQPLMRLDPIDLGLQTASAEAQLAAAERSASAARAQSVRAAADEVRLRSLVRSAAVSRQSYEQAKAAADAGLAMLAAAEAQADASRANAGAVRRQGGYAVLEADGDGLVMSTSAEPGQVVTAGQVVLRLALDGPREAVVSVPESRRGELPIDARASLYGSGRDMPAHLRTVSSSADPLTRTYEARYVLDGGAAGPALGSTVTLDLAEEARAVLSVPLAAVFDLGGGPSVWVVDPASMRLAARRVVLAGLGEEAASVSGGLRVGERVVALGATLLHEGDVVRLEQAP